MERERITVESAGAGTRLDQYLATRLSNVSRTQIQRLVAEGAVLLNGCAAAKKHSVSPGDVIDIDFSMAHPRPFESIPLPQRIPIEVLYEDESLIAVNKPAGLVVHPGNGVPDGTLVNALLFRGQALSEGFSPERPGIVHRLDKDTSGVVLAAKTDRAHTRLATSFACRAVSKRYTGFCIGIPSSISGTVDLPLDRSRREPLKRTVSAGGKEARTDYELIVHRSGISVMDFYPHTGRTHQIRVHCSTGGFPILADVLYGGGKERILRVDPAERPFAYRIYKCFGRHALHALEISFDHPENGRRMTIRAPFPDDFQDAVRMFNDPDLQAQLNH